MSNCYVRESTVDDCYLVGFNLRQSDLEEVFASHGSDGLEAVRTSFGLSDECYTFCSPEGLPIAIGGWCSDLTSNTKDIGYPWLLATPEITEYKLAFYKESLRLIERANKVHKRLLVYVDARHAESLAWLISCGFEIVTVKENHGYEGRPFVVLSRSKYISV